MILWYTLKLWWWNRKRRAKTTVVEPAVTYLPGRARHCVGCGGHNPECPCRYGATLG